MLRNQGVRAVFRALWGGILLFGAHTAVAQTVSVSPAASEAVLNTEITFSGSFPATTLADSVTNAEYRIFRCNTDRGVTPHTNLTGATRGGFGDTANCSVITTSGMNGFGTGKSRTLPGGNDAPKYTLVAADFGKHLYFAVSTNAIFSVAPVYSPPAQPPVTLGAPGDSTDAGTNLTVNIYNRSGFRTNNNDFTIYACRSQMPAEFDFANSGLCKDLVTPVVPAEGSWGSDAMPIKITIPTPALNAYLFLEYNANGSKFTSGYGPITFPATGGDLQLTSSSLIAGSSLTLTASLSGVPSGVYAVGFWQCPGATTTLPTNSENNEVDTNVCSYLRLNRIITNGGMHTVPPAPGRPIQAGKVVFAILSARGLVGDATRLISNRLGPFRAPITVSISGSATIGSTITPTATGLTGAQFVNFNLQGCTTNVDADCREGGSANPMLVSEHPTEIMEFTSTSSLPSLEIKPTAVGKYVRAFLYVAGTTYYSNFLSGKVPAEALTLATPAPLEFTAGVSINPSVALPSGMGGTGEKTYTLAIPSGLPAGLSVFPRNSAGMTGTPITSADRISYTHANTAGLSISGVPTMATNGAVQATYTVRDAENVMTPKTFTITVLPAVPTLSSNAEGTVITVGGVIDTRDFLSTYEHFFYRCDNPSTAADTNTERPAAPNGCTQIGDNLNAANLEGGGQTGTNFDRIARSYQIVLADDLGKYIRFGVFIESALPENPDKYYLTPGVLVTAAPPPSVSSDGRSVTFSVGSTSTAENRVCTTLPTIMNGEGDLTHEVTDLPNWLEHRQDNGQRLCIKVDADSPTATTAPHIRVTYRVSEAPSSGGRSAEAVITVRVNPAPAPAASGGGGGSGAIVALVIAGGAYYWWKKRQIANGNAAAMALLPDVSFDLDRNDRRAFYTKFNWQNSGNSNWQLRGNAKIHTKYDGKLLDWNANSHIGYRLQGKFGDFNPYLRGKFVQNAPENAEMDETYTLGVNYSVPNRFSVQFLQPDDEIWRYSLKTEVRLPKRIVLKFNQPNSDIWRYSANLNWQISERIGLNLSQPNNDLPNYGFGVQWRNKSKIRYGISGETVRNSYRFTGQYSF